MKEYVLVIDCGATNIKAAAVNMEGIVISQEVVSNRAVKQEPDKPWLIWDIEKIWASILLCSGKVAARVGPGLCRSVVVTSFSDDGAPVDREGRLLYPVISWECDRTVSIAENIKSRISEETLYAVTGEQMMRQHTLFRLLWLKQNAPEVLDKAYKYLMFSSIINYRLTGEMVTEPTTADSMLLLDIRRRKLSGRLLKIVDLEESFFGRLVEPGQVIGHTTDRITKKLGFSRNIPVVAAGHDTQFALYGSGCKIYEAALSSGTWEILFMRHNKCYTTNESYHMGIKNECDPLPGLYNIGSQWIGSGVIEWLIGLCFPGNQDRYSLYKGLMTEAEELSPGCGGLMVDPSFLKRGGMGNLGNNGGTILGCSLNTTAPELYRACLEGLAFKLKEALDNLKKLTSIDISYLTVTGGGAYNKLWNQIRADVLNLPVMTTRQRENTFIGAAIFGFVGAEIFASFDEACEAIHFKGPLVMPSSMKYKYRELYNKYKQNLSGLDKIYGKRL